MVAQRTEHLEHKYGVAIPRDSQSGYLVVGELAGAFAAAGWSLEVHGWPQPAVEWTRDLLEIAKHGRRTARFPVLIGVARSEAPGVKPAPRADPATLRDVTRDGELAWRDHVPPAVRARAH